MQKHSLTVIIGLKRADSIKDALNNFRDLFEEHQRQMEIKNNEMMRQLELVTGKTHIRKTWALIQMTNKNS